MIRASNEDSVPSLGKSEKSIRSENFDEHYDSTNQGSGAPDSLLLPSEPLDVKNWFSSYEYESFVLETNDNFGFSDHEDTENDGLTGKKKTSNVLIKCKRSEEDNKCEHRGFIQVLESPDSPLLSPEPPGIEKWFSSYVYESPIPDTGDELEFSDHKEVIVDKEDHGNKKRNEVENGENLFVTDDLICKQTTECERLKESDYGSSKDGKKSSSPDDLICKQTPDDERLEECDYGSTKDGKTSIEDLRNKLPKEMNHESVSTKASSFKNTQISPIKLEANGGLWKRTRSDKNEGRENGFVVKGFVSSRKKLEIENKENSMSCRGENESRKIKSRKILGDTTNIVMGKWKCPRKSKPDLGPPLKQLRLGEWFHREDRVGTGPKRAGTG